MPTEFSTTQRRMYTARYGKASYEFGIAPNDFLKKSEPVIKRHGRVLCLADGEGRNGVWLAGRGHRVTSVDIAAPGVEKTRQLAGEKGVALDAIEADILDWMHTAAAEGPWDAIVSIFFHLPPELGPIVGAAFADRLAPRGVLILEAYSPDQLRFESGGPRDEAFLYTPERVRDEWPGLSIEARTVERYLAEGMRHVGRASVTQALGQRVG